MSRIGVFICHCGENIGKTVDCARVAAAARLLPGVVHAVDYRYTCSEPGQAQIRDGIAQHKLTGVVVGACSPRMHEKTFRKTCATAGLNPYMCEIANLREQCSWVHSDREQATRKAIDIMRSTVARVQRNTPLSPIRVPLTRRALVIGGGIAGIPCRTLPVVGRPHVAIVRDVPDAGLFAMHPDAAHGRGSVASQDPVGNVQRSGEGRRLRRQLRGHDPPQSPQR